MIPKSGNRFSDKIMRNNKNAYDRPTTCGAVAGNRPATYAVNATLQTNANSTHNKHAQPLILSTPLRLAQEMMQRRIRSHESGGAKICARIGCGGKNL